MGKEQTVAPCFRRFPACAVGRAGAIQRGEQGRKAARLSVQRWQGCGSFPIRRRFPKRKTVVLAKARTITNSPQAKQVTWEGSVTEFAGRVQRVTGIQWSVLSVGVQRLKEKVAILQL